ncbi:Sugar transporter ERD6-like 16 [Hibiscus syriacus]|uniref:Sugar transporter ERD6-like 16 n=1 Tax=Hibiscus syriacus TaxID=106335 RepID=A0A6A3AKD8_HIBSY|nr:sugar transporter ERD6-like 7 [Hibiscus syriacus]KAE8703735.1 Sugar transporter ERD6-like 16 [Hibiscus syriacus]
MAIKEDIERGNHGDGEEVSLPLLQEDNDMADKEVEYTDQTSTNASLWKVYFSTFVAVCGSFEFGSCAGYSSPTQAAIRNDLSLTLAEYSVFGSILTFGAMIGAITSGKIADFVGRKGAMRTAAGFCLGGWLAIYFAQGALVLDIGRLATGYGMGVFSYVVPVFIAEIAPKNLRGALTTVNQLMICSGVSVAFIIGTVLKWRTLALTGLIPCAILLFGLFFIPESPRWLAKIGREKEFEAALQDLRGKDADISKEAAEILDYIETLERLPKAKMLDLFQRRYLRSVIIGVGLMVFQQFGGINGICFYTSNIFESAGSSATVGTITYAILQVVITGLNTTMIDRSGRKPLLLVSSTGLVLGCILSGISFYLKDHNLALNAVPILAVTGILVYISAFSAGMGAVPWVIMSEIFPINIKGVAGSLVTLVNWFGAWAVSYTFNFLMSWSSYGTFILYAAINAAAILFVVTLVPETKGKTLEQIQAAINA